MVRLFIIKLKINYILENINWKNAKIPGYRRYGVTYLLGSQRIKVDHKQDAQRILIRIETEDEFAELEGGPVTGPRSNKGQVTKHGDVKCPENPIWVKILKIIQR